MRLRPSSGLLYIPDLGAIPFVLSFGCRIKFYASGQRNRLFRPAVS